MNGWVDLLDPRYVPSNQRGHAACQAVVGHVPSFNVMAHKDRLRSRSSHSRNAPHTAGFDPNLTSTTISRRLFSFVIQASAELAIQEWCRSGIPPTCRLNLRYEQLKNILVLISQKNIHLPIAKTAVRRGFRPTVDFEPQPPSQSVKLDGIPAGTTAVLVRIDQVLPDVANGQHLGTLLSYKPHRLLGLRWHSCSCVLAECPRHILAMSAPRCGARLSFYLDPKRVRCSSREPPASLQDRKEPNSHFSGESC